MSLDANLCISLGICCTLILWRHIIIGKDAMWITIWTGLAFGLIIQIAFEAGPWRGQAVAASFVIITAMMISLFEYVIRPSVPGPFLYRAYVLDMGLLNGVVSWYIISP